MRGFCLPALLCCSGLDLDLECAAGTCASGLFFSPSLSIRNYQQVSVLIFLLRPPPVHLPFLGILLVPVPCLRCCCSFCQVRSGHVVGAVWAGRGAGLAHGGWESPGTVPGSIWLQRCTTAQNGQFPPLVMRLQAS